MPVGWTLTDNSRPYTKSIVQAMQLRIDTLEAQLEAMTVQSGAPTGTNTPAGGQAAPLPSGLDVYGGPSLVPKHTPLDAFQGGLACVSWPHKKDSRWR